MSPSFALPHFSGALSFGKSPLHRSTFFRQPRHREGGEEHGEPSDAQARASRRSANFHSRDAVSSQSEIGTPAGNAIAAVMQYRFPSEPSILCKKKSSILCKKPPNSHRFPLEKKNLKRHQDDVSQSVNQCAFGRFVTAPRTHEKRDSKGRTKRQKDVRSTDRRTLQTLNVQLRRSEWCGVQIACTIT